MLAQPLTQMQKLFWCLCLAGRDTPLHKTLLRSGVEVFSVPSLPKQCVCLGSSKGKCFQNSGFCCICVFSLVSDKHFSTGKKYKLPRKKRIYYPVILPLGKKTNPQGSVPSLKENGCPAQQSGHTCSPML